MIEHTSDQPADHRTHPFGRPELTHVDPLDQIRLRAYEIYMARGGADGYALNDWLQAESELAVKTEGQSA